METLRLNVLGICCDGSVTTIRMAVGRLQGIDSLNGDAKARTITVEYDASTLTVEQIQQALESVGYDSTVVP